MKILVINAGSSSLKFQIINWPTEEVLVKGLVERIGLSPSKISFETNTTTFTEEFECPNHEVALKKVVEEITDGKEAILKDKNEITAVGHRVVHGGSMFNATVEISDVVKDKIKELFDLAPLHNPANLKGIKVAERLFPNAHQVAVFDTAFFVDLPKKAKLYAIPLDIAEEYKIQKYGFHGTSHKYVSYKASEYLGKDNSKKIISIHLGNGCSITAIQEGKAVEHSLGFGPNEGLIMGTRTGSIDQSIIFYLANKMNKSLDEISSIFTNESGMLGLTGMSDLREIESAAATGNEQAQLALEMNAHRIKMYIGAYTAILNGLDAIVFTAGIGENSELIRSLVCKDLEYLGIELNETINQTRSKSIREIQSKDSKVKVLVIPTNEELEIARQTAELIQ